MRGGILFTYQEVDMGLVQNLSFELEKLREERISLASTPLSFEGQDATQQAETISQRDGKLATLNSQIQDVLSRRNAAQLNDADQDEGVSLTTSPVADTADPESKEVFALQERASLTKYLQYARRRIPMRGVEREYAQAILGEGEDRIHNAEGGPVVPFEYFLSPQERAKVEVQMREFTAPTVTSADTADVVRTMTLQRLFSDTVSEYLRVQYEAAPPGTRTYPVFATGADPSSAGVTTVARKAEIARASTSITATAISPERFGINYLLYVEDEAMLAGATMLHEQDVRSALQQALDWKVLGKVLGSVTDPTPASARETRGGYLNVPASFLDGIYAPGVEYIRLLWPLEMYSDAWNMRNDETDLNVFDVLNRQGVTNRATDKLVLDGTTKEGDLIVIREMHEGPVAPIWGGVNLVADRVTGVRKGEISLTIYMLANLHVRRADKTFAKSPHKIIS